MSRPAIPFATFTLLLLLASNCYAQSAPNGINQSGANAKGTVNNYNFNYGERPASPSKSELMRQMLQNFEENMTREKIREMLGAPAARNTISVAEGKRKTSYTVERYESEVAKVFIVGDAPIRGIAIAVRDDVPFAKKAALPVPYLYAGTEPAALGDFPLDNLRGSCEGHPSDAQAKFQYVVTPTCYFRGSGGYKYFVFAFDGGDVSDCSVDIFSLSERKFDDIRCEGFWSVRPNFALTYMPQADEKAPEKQANAMAEAVLELIYHW
jgi:hypothetical protein